MSTRPPVRLCLHVPADVAFETFEAVLDAVDVASLALASGRGASETKRFIEAAQGRGVAALIAGDAALAKATGADGVEIAWAPGAVKAARATLGGDAILGAVCGLSRHEAMEAGEAGADYVVFGEVATLRAAASPATPPPHFHGNGEADPEIDAEDEPDLEAILGWWQDVMEVPCVAGDATSPETAARAARAGADFVTASADLWSATPSPIEAARRFAAALASAVSSD